MFCPKCGANLPDNATFCGNCGTPLQANQAPAPAQGQASAYGHASSAYAPAARPGIAIDPKILRIASIVLAVVIALCMTGRWLSITGLDSVVDIANQQMQSNSYTSGMAIPKIGAITSSVPGLRDSTSTLQQVLDWVQKASATAGGSIGGLGSSEMMILSSLAKVPAGPVGFFAILWAIALIAVVGYAGYQLAGKRNTIAGYVCFGLAAVVAIAFIIVSGNINGQVSDAIRGLVSMAGSSTSDMAVVQSLLSKKMVGTTAMPIIVLIASILGLVANFFASRTRA